MPITKTIAKHPFITGAAIIGVGLLFLLLHSAGGGSSAPAGGAAPGPNPNVQIAGIQAGTALQSQSNAITQQTNQNNYQLMAQAQQLQASLTATQLQNQTQLSLGTQSLGNEALKINSDTAVQGAAIAAQIEQLRLTTAASVAEQANALTTQQNIAQIAANTQVTLNSQNQQTQQLQIGTQAQTAIAQTQAAQAIAESANNAAVTINQQNNATVLGQAALQTQQVINGQNVAGTVATTISNNQTSVENNYITTSGTVAQAGITAQQQQNNSIINLIQSGQLNKGGAGGANQVSVLGAITGYPQIGAPAQQTAQTGSLSTASIISSIATGAGSIFKSIFA